MANVYWIDRGTPAGGGKEPLSSIANGQVLKCPVTGCGNAPTVLASYPTWLGAGALAVDGTDVYWSMEDVSGMWGQIVRCAMGGCGGAPVPLASTATHLSQRSASPSTTRECTGPTRGVGRSSA